MPQPFPQFVDAGHSTRFLEARAKLAESAQRNSEWLSTLYLLTLSADVWNRVRSAVNLTAETINWILINRVPWSESEKLLVTTASQCYGHLSKPAISSLWYTLSDRWFEAVLFALRIRRYGATEIDWGALWAGVAHV